MFVLRYWIISLKMAGSLLIKILSLMCYNGKFPENMASKYDPDTVLISDFVTVNPSVTPLTFSSTISFCIALIYYMRAFCSSHCYFSLSIFSIIFLRSFSFTSNHSIFSFSKFSCCLFKSS